jgi:hypothetical protein
MKYRFAAVAELVANSNIASVILEKAPPRFAVQVDAPVPALLSRVAVTVATDITKTLCTVQPDPADTMIEFPIESRPNGNAALVTSVVVAPITRSVYAISSSSCCE